MNIFKLLAMKEFVNNEPDNGAPGNGSRIAESKMSAPCLDNVQADHSAEDL